MPLLGLGGGGEDGLRQTVRQAQARRERHAADSPAGLIFLPAAASQVAPHHALHRQGPGLLHHHGAARQQVPVGLQPRGPGAVPPEVVGHQVGGGLKPVGGHGREDAALVGDALRHHAVKSTDAVRGHDEELAAQVINVPHLAPAEDGKGQVGAEQDGHGTPGQTPSSQARASAASFGLHASSGKRRGVGADQCRLEGRRA